MTTPPLPRRDGESEQRRSLRAMIDPDHDTIDILDGAIADGAGLLLSMTFEEAEDICSQITSLLGVIDHE